MFRMNTPKSKIAFVIILLTCTLRVFAQDESQADYLRNTNLPPFTLLAADSATLTRDELVKDKNILIMLFSPDCAHCRRQTDSIIANMDRLKDVEIVMATFEPFDKMVAFNKEYRLSDYPNVKLGRDTRYFLIPFYGAL